MVPKPMWKTHVTIWTDYNPQRMELEALARQATCGDAYCSHMHIEQVNDPSTDPEFPPVSGFFDQMDDG